MAVAYLFWERVGHDCVSRVFADFSGYPDGYFDALAEELRGDTGFVSDNRLSYVGSFEETFEAWGLTSIGLEYDDIAYGLGRVPAWRAPYGPPTGTWWAPEFMPFELADGRTGWTHTSVSFSAPMECEF